MKKKLLSLAVSILAAVAPLSAQVSIVSTTSGQADLFPSTALTPATFELAYTLQGGALPDPAVASLTCVRDGLPRAASGPSCPAWGRS